MWLRGGWRKWGPGTGSGQILLPRGRSLYNFRESSGNAKIKQMRKRASDFSPCKGAGVGNKFEGLARPEATVWAWCSLPAPCLFDFIFWVGGGSCKRKRDLRFHLTPMSPSLLSRLPHPRWVSFRRQSPFEGWENCKVSEKKMEGRGCNILRTYYLSVKYIHTVGNLS